MVQIKVYDRVCSLNQRINWFFLCYIFFLSIYSDNSFFANIFLKLIGKNLQWFQFCVSGVFDNLTWIRELEGLRWVKETDKNEWVNNKYICNYFINYLINSLEIKCNFLKPVSFYIKTKKNKKICLFFDKLTFFEKAIFRIFNSPITFLRT